MLANTKYFCYSLALRNKPFWLTMIGASGTGKTHLARKVAEFVNEHLHGVYTGVNIIHWPAFYDRMKQEGAWDLARFYCETRDILIIDELAQTGGDYCAQQLALMAELRRGKWTIWTSNLSLEEINDTIDPRVTSRMLRYKSIVVALDKNVKDYNG